MNKKIIVSGLTAILCLGGTVYDNSSNVRAVEVSKNLNILSSYAGDEIVQFDNPRLAQLLVEQMLDYGARDDLTIGNITVNDLHWLWYFYNELNWTSEKESLLIGGNKVSLGGFDVLPYTSLNFKNIDNDFKMDLSSYYGTVNKLNNSSWKPYAEISFSNLTEDSETFDWKSVKDTWKVDEMFDVNVLKGNYNIYITGIDGCYNQGSREDQDPPEIYRNNDDLGDRDDTCYAHNVNLIEKGLTIKTYQNFEIPISAMYSANFEMKYKNESYEEFNLELLDKLSDPVVFINENGDELVYKIRIKGLGQDAKFIFELESGEYKGGTYTPNDGQYPNPQKSWTKDKFAQSYFFKINHSLNGFVGSAEGDGSYWFTGYGYFVLKMEDEKIVDPEIDKPEKEKVEKKKENKKEDKKPLPKTGASLTSSLVSLVLGLAALVVNGYYRLKK